MSREQITWMLVVGRWKLRWSGPRVRKLRRIAADYGYSPRPPDMTHPGETPRQFRDRLRWAFMDHAGFLKRDTLP